MLVYRITLRQFAKELKASGRAARWNPNKTEMIYTASNRSLACLENVVHRGQSGLIQIFSVMTIEVDNTIKQEKIELPDLASDWRNFEQTEVTQSIGKNWLLKNQTAILQVPSSIIEEEVNFLLNPNHPDFIKIKLIKTQPFTFDKRIKL